MPWSNEDLRTFLLEAHIAGRLFEAYGVRGVMEGPRCRVSPKVTVQWHGDMLGIAAY